MPVETTVTVVIGSEVSASVLPNVSNTIASIATSTPDVSWWQDIINWVLNLL